MEDSGRDLCDGNDEPSEFWKSAKFANDGSRVMPGVGGIESYDEPYIPNRADFVKFL